MRTVFYGAIMLFLISSLLLLLKQIPDIRETFNNNGLLFKLNELIYKFGYAVFFIVFLNFIPLRKNIFLGNKFLSFCSTISLELYLVHFSLRYIVDSRIYSIVVFLLLSFSFSFLLYRFNNFLTKRM